jgi:hypothetical protein
MVMSAVIPMIGAPNNGAPGGAGNGARPARRGRQPALGRRSRATLLALALLAAVAGLGGDRARASHPLWQAPELWCSVVNESGYHSEPVVGVTTPYVWALNDFNWATWRAHLGYYDADGQWRWASTSDWQTWREATVSYPAWWSYKVSGAGNSVYAFRGVATGGRYWVYIEVAWMDRTGTQTVKTTGAWADGGKPCIPYYS